MCTDRAQHGGVGGAQAWGSPSGKGQTAQETWPGPGMSPEAPQPQSSVRGPPVCAGAPQEDCGDIQSPQRWGQCSGTPGLMAQASSLSLLPESLRIPHEPLGVGRVPRI